MTTSNVVHSQAFGFMSYLQSGVDPRTGLYTVSIELPAVSSNWLCGPAFPLSLSFSPINTRDSGYGVGWNLNLSQFTPADSILALSTGETYKVTGSGAEPDIKEKKLDSFHFENLGENRYRVTHKSGLIEVLQVGGSSEDRVALPVEIYSPAGHCLKLVHASFRGGQRLQSISDAQGELLRINRANDTQVEILARPDSGPDGAPLARYEMNLNASGWVTSIVLPTDEKASWRFGYGNGPIRDILCLHEVKTPVGGRETIEYGDDGHPFPAGGNPKNLPRVTRHNSFPGFGQPKMEMVYRYTTNNFLGNGTNVNLEPGMDPMYNAPHTHMYGTTACLMDGSDWVRKVERTFNRFHLLTEETTTQGNCVKRVKTEFYAEDVPFSAQPPQFQLPKKITTNWELTNDSTKYRSEEELSAFDVHGNPIEMISPSGIKTTYSYYPKEGEKEDGENGEVYCPPDRFVRNLKDTVVTPSDKGESGAPTLRTRLRYAAHKPLTSSGLEFDWLAIRSETLEQVDNETVIKELQQTQHTYNQLVGNAFLHGRPATKTTTINGKTGTTTYTYEMLNSVQAEETVLQTTELFRGFDDVPGRMEVRKTIISEDSLLHGKPLLTRDDLNVRIRYTYDALTRVLSETVAPGVTEFEATRYYTYFLTSTDGQQAEQVTTDVKGVKTRTRVDGLNRPIYEERQDADNPQRASEFRQTYFARYDFFDNLVEETHYDWRGEEQEGQTTTFQFDAWGMQRCTIGPDEIKVIEETNPIGTLEWKAPIQTSWREGAGAQPLTSGKTLTYLNLFEKPNHIERLETDGTIVSKHQYGYDGLGRTVREIDARDAITRFVYDEFDRLVANILPGGATVKRTYAEHSAEDLPIEISVDGRVLGLQAFDGLGRMKESVTGGRPQFYTYEPGHFQPATVTNARGQLIQYAYELQLSDEPKRRSLPGKTPAEYVHDGKNARLVSCKEDGLELQRAYFSTGNLKSEKRIQNSQSYDMYFDYSRLGLLLNYTDVLGQTQSYNYDAASRLKNTQLGTTYSQFTYDSLGQTRTISTQDSASEQSVTISLEYDGLGREITRSFDLNGVEQQLTQVYNAVDALVSRTLKEGPNPLRAETYGYDSRGRLVLYTSAGDQSPVDPYGKVIKKQVFRFDAIDNLTRVTTTYENLDGTSGTNVAEYFYEGVDPAQLTKVTNTPTGFGYPAEIVLKYNDDGHMVRDEEGRTLEYDELGRLARVSGLAGETPTDYHYDPQDTLSWTEGEHGQDQRFYQDDNLVNQLQGSKNSTFMRGYGVVLAERQEGDGPKF